MDMFKRETELLHDRRHRLALSVVLCAVVVLFGILFCTTMKPNGGMRSYKESSVLSAPSLHLQEKPPALLARIQESSCVFS